MSLISDVSCVDLDLVEGVWVIGAGPSATTGGVPALHEVSKLAVQEKQETGDQAKRDDEFSPVKLRCDADIGGEVKKREAGRRDPGDVKTPCKEAQQVKSSNSSATKIAPQVTKRKGKARKKAPSAAAKAAPPTMAKSKKASSAKADGRAIAKCNKAKTSVKKKK